MDTLKKLEIEGDNSSRFAITEELKAMPMSLVWDYYCEKQGVPVGKTWIDDAKAYEKNVLAGR